VPNIKKIVPVFNEHSRALVTSIRATLESNPGQSIEGKRFDVNPARFSIG
jgi:hypothetical protein